MIIYILNANANEIVNWSTIRVYDSNNVQVNCGLWFQEAPQ